MLQWGRELNRGNGREPTAAEIADRLASMGPRIESRKWELVGILWHDKPKQLQWGRELNRGNGNRESRRGHRAGVLQWGRELNRGNGRTRVLLWVGDADGFNGAAN